MQNLDLDSLSLDQLSQYKTSEEQKLQQITSHYQQLRAAAARFTNSKETLGMMGKDYEGKEGLEGKEVMVPLTASLYVPGTIVAPQRVMLELGTGFYAEKSLKDASKFLDRKIDLVGKNADSIFQALLGTRRNVEAIVMVMQGKIAERNAQGN
jgi:prefoldin alpha subunit